MDRKHHITAALLLGRATPHVLPNVVPIQPYVTDDEFGYDFVYKGAFHADLIPEIERFMQRVRNESEPLKLTTMMRENAVVFLEHHEKDIQAALAEVTRSNMVELVDFDLVREAPLESFRDLPEYRLYDVIQKQIDYPPLGEISWLRIVGRVFPDKQAMKAYTKLDALAKKIDPVAILKKNEIIDLQDRPFWGPKGLVLLEAFQKLWKEGLSSCGIVPVMVPTVQESKRGLQCYQERDIEYDEPMALPRLQDYPFSKKAACWIQKEVSISDPTLDALFRTRLSTGDLFRLTVEERELSETVTLLLQFIQKIATLLSFKPNFTLLKPSTAFVQALRQEQYIEERAQEALSGTRLEVHFEDMMGRKWLTSLIQVEEKKGSTVVLRGSFFFSLERMVALMVQKENGLPNWVAQIVK